MLFVGIGYTEIANRFSSSKPTVAQSKPPKTKTYQYKST